MFAQLVLRKMTRSTELILAHGYCQHLAKSHYENFPVASILLPKHLQQPIFVVYAFARTADDIADEGIATNAERMQALVEYEEQLNDIEQGSEVTQSPIFMALSDVVYSHQLPIQLFHDLLTAFKQDISQGRYQTDGDILVYCRRSANPIGRILLHLAGERSMQQIKESDALCTGLQLINFYQDIKQDLYENNRLYLSLESLSRLGITEHNLDVTNTTKIAPLLRERYLFINHLLMSAINLGAEVNGRMGWEIRTITLAGLFTLKKLSLQNNDNLSSRPRLTKYIILKVASLSFLTPIYRQVCLSMIKRIIKLNQLYL